LEAQCESPKGRATSLETTNEGKCDIRKEGKPEKASAKTLDGRVEAGCMMLTTLWKQNNVKRGKKINRKLERGGRCYSILEGQLMAAGGKTTSVSPVWKRGRSSDEQEVGWGGNTTKRSIILRMVVWFPRGGGEKTGQKPPQSPLEENGLWGGGRLRR